MDEIKDRLQWARAAAGFEQAADAARRFGWSESTYYGHENGDRKPRLDRARIYAKAFKVRWEWLFHGTGEPHEAKAGRPAPAPISVPVVSWVSAGRIEPVLNTRPIRSEYHVLPKGDWAGLEVRGDSMDRIAPDGALILVDRSDTTLLDGRFYVISLEGEGDATFKRYRAKPERLMPYSLNPDHDPIDVTPEMRVFGRVKKVITTL